MGVESLAVQLVNAGSLPSSVLRVCDKVFKDGSDMYDDGCPASAYDLVGGDFQLWVKRAAHPLIKQPWINALFAVRRPHPQDWVRVLGGRWRKRLPAGTALHDFVESGHKKMPAPEQREDLRKIMHRVEPFLIIMCSELEKARRNLHKGPAEQNLYRQPQAFILDVLCAGFLDNLPRVGTPACACFGGWGRPGFVLGPAAYTRSTGSTTSSSSSSSASAVPDSKEEEEEAPAAPKARRSPLEPESDAHQEPSDDAASIPGPVLPVAASGPEPDLESEPVRAPSASASAPFIAPMVPRAVASKRKQAAEQTLLAAKGACGQTKDSRRKRRRDGDDDAEEKSDGKAPGKRAAATSTAVEGASKPAQGHTSRFKDKTSTKHHRVRSPPSAEWHELWIGCAQAGTVKAGMRLELAHVQTLRLRKIGATGSKQLKKKVRFLLDGSEKTRLPGGKAFSGRRGALRRSGKGARRKPQAGKTSGSGARRWDGAGSPRRRLRSRRNTVLPQMLEAIRRGDTRALLQLLRRFTVSPTQRRKLRAQVQEMNVMLHLELMKTLGLAPEAEQSVSLVEVHADGRRPLHGERIGYSDVTLQWATVSATGERSDIEEKKLPLHAYGSWCSDDVMTLTLMTGCVPALSRIPPAAHLQRRSAHHVRRAHGGLRVRRPRVADDGGRAAAAGDAADADGGDAGPAAGEPGALRAGKPDAHLPGLGARAPRRARGAVRAAARLQPAPERLLGRAGVRPADGVHLPRPDAHRLRRRAAIGESTGPLPPPPLWAHPRRRRGVWVAVRVQFAAQGGAALLLPGPRVQRDGHAPQEPGPAGEAPQVLQASLRVVSMIAACFISF